MKHPKKPYRLALDIGTNSIGWACIKLAEDKEINAETGEVRLQYSPAGFLKSREKPAGGVVLFPDGRNPKYFKTYNAERRGARGRRRVVAARKWRLRKLRRLLVNKLSCADEKVFAHLGARLEEEAKRDHDILSNIYELRFEAAYKQLDAPEKLAAVLLHMARHRYFQSNSLAEGEEDEAEEKAWQQDEEDLRNDIKAWMEKHNRDKREQRPETVGGYYCLWLRHLRERRESEPGEWRGAGVRQHIKAMAKKAAKKDEKDKGEESPKRPRRATRQLIREEFEIVRERQKEKFAKQLSKDDWETIEDLVLDQRPLKPKEPATCALGGEDCAPEALPTIALWRIMQTANNLRLREKDTLQERPLTLEERDKIVEHLRQHAKTTNTKLRQLIKMGGKKAVFTIEEKPGPASKEQKGDMVAQILAKEDALGESYHSLPLDERDEIVDALLEYRTNLTRGKGGASRRNKMEAHRKLEKKLSAHPFNLNLDKERERVNTLKRIAALKIPTDHISVCEEVATRTLGEMKKAPDCSFATAAELCNYEVHAHKTKKRKSRTLPYYGRALKRRISHPPANGGDKDEPQVASEKYGMINNITVHVALNQLRKLVNAVIHAHGKPAQVIVEMNRDMAKGAEDRFEIRKKQDAGQVANEEIRKEIEKGISAPKCGWIEAIKRYKLWKEQGEKDLYDCVSNEPKIGLTELFGNKYEIDHIIPLARGGVDKAWNMVVTKTTINRNKSNQTAQDFDGFDGFNYEQFKKRVEDLVKAESDKDKQKRLRSRLAYFTNWKEEKSAGERPAHQEASAPYIAKIALEYLGVVCNDVKPTTGYITHELRKYLGFTALDESGHAQGDRLFKDRRDVRNHFLDAVVVGLADAKTTTALHNIHAQQQKNIAGKERHLSIKRAFSGRVRKKWPGYYQDVRDLYEEITPARRQKHWLPHKKRGADGQLHEETHLSVWREATPEEKEKFGATRIRVTRTENAGEKTDGGWIGYRRAVADIAPKLTKWEDFESLGGDMSHKTLFRKIGRAINDSDKKTLSERFLEACAKYGVHKISRLEKGAAQEIRRGKNSAKVKSGNNDRLEIWQNKKAKAEWRGVAVNFLQATRERKEGKKEGTMPPDDAPDKWKYLGAFRRNDYVRFDESEASTLWMVKGINNRKKGVSLSLWPVNFSPPSDDKEMRKEKNKAFYKVIEGKRGGVSSDGKECSVNQLRKQNPKLYRVNILGELKEVPWS